MPPATRGITGRVVETALSVELDSLSELARTRTRHAFVDLIACALAGSVEPPARIVADWALGQGGRADATVIGSDSRDGRVPAALAALVNGTAAHALDYDDVAMTMIHPSAAVVPALLAVGERQHLSGTDLMAAYAAGFEVQGRLCRVLNPEHYARGWHTMQTVGVLGATLAVCRLVRSDPEVSARAVGIAASSSAGLRKNFGSMVKPLHAGHAAQHAVEAYELATLGFTGDEDVLDGTHGFLAVFSEPARADAVADAFDIAAPSELEESGVAVKRFACCGAIHTALDSVEALVREHELTPADVRHVECRVNPITPGILVHHEARSGLEGKFSLQYSLAVMLLTGRAGLSQFTDELAADPEVRSLMKRVEMKVDDSLPVELAYFPTIVTMELADGTTISRRTDVQYGYPERPMSADDLAAKARDCAAGVLPDDALERVLTSLSTLESCPDVAAVAAELRRAETA